MQPRPGQVGVTQAPLLERRGEPLPGEGLRERKKRERRLAIARAALRLFARHGFEQVSIAEVARAADVAEMTVFNYFPTKEQLLFFADRERELAVVGAVRDRPPGTSIVAAFRGAATELLAHAWGSHSTDWIRVVQASPTLQQYRRELYVRHARALAAALADELPAETDQLLLLAVARLLFGVLASAFEIGGQRVVEGRDPAEITTDLLASAARVFDRLEHGLADFGVR
jgi:AcrR family transcriptional regulator